MRARLGLRGSQVIDACIAYFAPRLVVIGVIAVGALIAISPPWALSAAMALMALIWLIAKEKKTQNFPSGWNAILRSYC
jgi:hypothetical protein